MFKMILDNLRYRMIYVDIDDIDRNIYIYTYMAMDQYLLIPFLGG